MSNKEFNRINICLSCDENYSKYAGVVIASILANAKAEDDLHFYILDGGVSKDSKEKILSLKNIKVCEIVFVPINNDSFEEYNVVKTHPYISLAACYRLKLASLLPNVNKVIYLDCDVSVCSSLSELFNIDLQNNVMAGVLDIDIKRKNRHPKHVNSGVLLMDLDKIRAENIEGQLLEYTRKNIDNIEMGDQEIINAVLTDKILIIDSKYNVQSECFIRRSSFTKNPVIVHFIGPQKPWHFGSWSVHKYLYFRYLQMTPWKFSDKEQKKWGLPNKIYSFYKWFCHRPFFCLQSKFWEAVRNDRKAKDGQKTFVVVLMACFGDIILCNSLFQNIKRLYSNSKIVFVIDKPWYEAAKYQPYVDEVLIFDKRGKNRGIIGMLSFIKNFPYKNIDYIFKIYDNDRMNILAPLMRPKKIVGKPYDNLVTVQERHNNLLKKISDADIINYPIKYIAKNDIPDKFKNIISVNKKYVAVCPCSSRIEKNMPIETTYQLINQLNNDNYEVLFTGTGNTAKNYAEELTNQGCKFINMVNKTSIYELAQIIRNCEFLISVDTGTMHFGYANNVPTLCVYYEKENIKYWAPNKNIYPYTIVTSSKNVAEIISQFNELKRLVSNNQERSLCEKV